MLDCSQILLAGFLAVTAYVFSCILIEDGMLLNKYQKVLNKLPECLANPLGACDLCFGGHIALWFYIFKYDYNLIEHIFFVSITIFFIKVINIIITKWEN